MEGMLKIKIVNFFPPVANIPSKLSDIPSSS